MSQQLLLQLFDNVAVVSPFGIPFATCLWTDPWQAMHNCLDPTCTPPTFVADLQTDLYSIQVWHFSDTLYPGLEIGGNHERVTCHICMVHLADGKCFFTTQLDWDGFANWGWLSTTLLESFCLCVTFFYAIAFLPFTYCSYRAFRFLHLCWPLNRGFCCLTTFTWCTRVTALASVSSERSCNFSTSVMSSHNHPVTCISHSSCRFPYQQYFVSP